MPSIPPEQPSTDNRQCLTDDAYHAVLEVLKDGEKHPELGGLIEQLHPADTADLIERLRPDQRMLIMPAVPKVVFGDVLAELSEGVQESVLAILEPEYVAEALAESGMESDDVVDIVQHMEEEDAEEALALIGDAHEERLASYGPETAGGIMQTEALTVSPDWSVGDVLGYIRNNGDVLPDDIATVFVLGARKRLVGSIGVSRMLRHELEVKIEDVMRTDPVTVDPYTSQKEVAQLFEKYDMYNMAVVAKNGVFLGRITADDVLDVVLEEHEKETLHMAGVKEGEDLFAPVGDTARQRLPWLVVNLGTAILASAVISLFEAQIERLVVLAILMPIVASMGGNAGTQTLAVTVRGLATGQITLHNAMYLLGKELLVGSLNGISLGVALGLGTWLVYGDSSLGMVILIATIANHVLAALAGHLVPILMEKMGRDPALSSGVLVTTVTDVGGFFVFLGLAALVLL